MVFMDKYVGKRLDGRYEIQEIVGIGGMAVVYKAYDNLENKTVAIKILKEEYTKNDEFLRRFKNESKAIAVLSHPNVSATLFSISLWNISTELPLKSILNKADLFLGAKPFTLLCKFSVDFSTLTIRV